LITLRILIYDRGIYYIKFYIFNREEEEVKEKKEKEFSQQKRKRKQRRQRK
jgi:hypothetical protein